MRTLVYGIGNNLVPRVFVPLDQRGGLRETRELKFLLPGRSNDVTDHLQETAVQMDPETLNRIFLSTNGLKLPVYFVSSF